MEQDQAGWDAVKEAIHIALGLDHFKSNGISKKFCCRNPLHEEEEASAGWHKDGYYKCFYCGAFNAKGVAEWLGIDWRALLRPQPQIVSSKDIDLDAAPRTGAETAPLALDEAPDSWLRLLNKFYTSTEAALFRYALPLCRTSPLAQGFTRDEFVKGVRSLGCNLKEDTIKKFFNTEVFKDDNHPTFAKVDPSEGSSSRNCRFRLRSLDDIQPSGR